MKSKKPRDRSNAKIGRFSLSRIAPYNKNTDCRMCDGEKINKRVFLIVVLVVDPRPDVQMSHRVLESRAYLLVKQEGVEGR